MPGALVLATRRPELEPLAAALGGEPIVIPDVDDDKVWAPSTLDALEEWRDDVAAGPSAEQVIVAAWPPDVSAATPLTEVDAAGFAARAERALLVWVAALGAATRRCADGGAIVAVVEQPPPLDSAGRAPECGVADAVEAWVRSLARSEGERGVRVNAVTTPGRLVAPALSEPPPPLASFPGTIEREVAEAARMLAGPGVAGVTGTVVHADCGRTGR